MYPVYPTRYRVKTVSALRGKAGIIWLRLGSEPPKPEYDGGEPGDLVLFSKEVIGRLGGKVILVTTDGDRSIPSGLDSAIVDNIMADSNIVGWYTQNLESPNRYSKLHPIPIGVDLHTRNSDLSRNPLTKEKMLKRAIKKSCNLEKRKLRIWSDVHLEANLGDMLMEYPKEGGKPGGKYFETRSELRLGIESGELSGLVDVPIGRIPLEDLWEKYGQYTFVISLPGHGLDCHRTWEALLLGAIVITVSTPLDKLLRPFKVVILERNDSQWWRALNEPGWIGDALEIAGRGKDLDLGWEQWIKPIDRLLASNCVD